jgi:hypothetical protein
MSRVVEEKSQLSGLKIWGSQLPDLESDIRLSRKISASSYKCNEQSVPRATYMLVQTQHMKVFIYIYILTY